MEPYLFQGVVFPERAQLTLNLSISFSHSNGINGVATISIILNKVAVWVERHDSFEWNIFDLKNLIQDLVQSQLDIIGYLKGLAYELEITRILNQSLKIDFVFGIEIPCIAELEISEDLVSDATKLLEITSGSNGLLVKRCFHDLVSAMKHVTDAGFYCYRAIESLKHHCAAVNNLTSSGKAEQWERFREKAHCDRNDIDLIKAVADPVRQINTHYRR